MHAQDTPRDTPKSLNESPAKEGGELGVPRLETRRAAGPQRKLLQKGRDIDKIAARAAHQALPL